jgi:hypothetical protein
MMNINWKIGVKIQARKLMGSAPGWAGTSGVGTGVADGAPEPLDPPGAQATTTSAINSNGSTGATARTERVMVTS